MAGVRGGAVRGVALVARRPFPPPTDKTPPRPTPSWPRPPGRPDPPDRRLPRRRLGGDAGEQRLHRGPDQRLLGDGPPVPHRVLERGRGRRGAGQAARTIPASRASTTNRSRAIPPDEDAGAGRAAPRRVRWRPNADAAPPAPASRTTPATSTSGTCASSACPTRGSGATARASWSRSSTPASRKVADLAETKFVAGYNFVANNDNAADDHGHGTHVAGTIAQSTNNKRRRRRRRLRRHASCRSRC